jgi:signal transduction histidine kinase
MARPYNRMITDQRVPRRWAPDGRLIDAAIVFGLVVVDLVAQIVVSTGGHAPSPPLGAVAVVVAVLFAAPLWWRRRRPLWVMVLVLVASVLSAGIVHPGLLSHHTGVPLALSTYAVGSWSTRRGWRVLVPAAVLLAVFGALSSNSGQLANAAAVALVVIALPWVAGVAARSRRSYILEVERRLAEAERERDERARLAVLDERRHIARELHDVVAHHVSLIGVQAGAARTALERSPETTRQALLAIEQSSRSAVGEMRQLLDVLTSEGAGGQMDPQPGLAGLDQLLDGFRRAGLRLSVFLSGNAATLSPVLDLCCYRVVEEALTNVARHSAAEQARVDISIGDAEVRIDVRDPGPARPGTAGTGRGLIGMRERIALFGGTLHAAPTADGGFAVTVGILTTPPSA